MKTLHLSGLLIALLSIVSCNKNKMSEIPPDNTRIEGPGGYYLSGDSVSTPEPVQNFEVIRYQTKMDTTYSADTIVVMIGSITISQPPAIRWSGATTTLPITFDYSNGWSDTYKKWVGVDQMKISTKNEFTDEHIRCELTFANGKKVERNTVVSLKHKVQNNDLFRLDFGMGIEQVKQSEEARKSAALSWREISPTLLQSNSKGKISERMQFQFTANQLSAVSEFGMDITSSKFNNFIKSAGSPVVFKRMNGAVWPSLPQSWSRNGIKYTVQNMDVNTVEGNKTMEVLTYEKAI